jgi:hypothetical protein
MANGTGQSKAPYIIICGGRIDVLNAKTKEDKLQAASSAAVRLVTYFGNKLNAIQTAPISNLQHQIMENLSTWNRSRAEQGVTDMFALLDALENEMEGHSY